MQSRDDLSKSWWLTTLFLKLRGGGGRSRGRGRGRGRVGLGTLFNLIPTFSFLTFFASCLAKLFSC